MRNLRVAVWQMESRRGNVDANLAKLADVLKDREVAKADLLVAPEMFLTGFTPEAKRQAAAEDGPVFQKIAKVVANAGLSFATSVLVERGDRQFNTFYLWGEDGEVIGHQDKLHLWDEEAARATPGDDTAPLATEWGKVGAMVCYDVEFPEVSRTLALGGAELLVVPGAFYTAASWDVATRARALENGCYLVGANQTGGTGARPHCGLSRIVDPFSTIVAEVPSGREGIITATLDGNQILKARNYAPYLRDRRLGLPTPERLVSTAKVS